MNAKILVILSVLLIALAFGCLGVSNETETYDKLHALEQKYFVTQNYSSNLASMNDYINELVQLKSKTTGASGKVIEAEIYSAQTFYYLQKALVDSTAIDYQNILCSSSEVKATYASAKLAKSSSKNAINSLSGLSDKEKLNLRENQLSFVNGYIVQIDQIIKFFDDEC